MTALSADQLAQFRDLIATNDGFKEQECSAFLQGATGFLMPQTPFRLKELNLEERSPYGRSDYMIVADIKSGHGQVETHMVFFELKAPQCFLMQADDADRYRPSPDLVKAETQLIHYVEHAKNDGDLREKHGILSAHHIYAGGIIIGRDDRIARVQTAKEIRDAHHSLKLRERALYGDWRILTWDRILEFVTPPVAALA